MAKALPSHHYEITNKTTYKLICDTFSYHAQYSVCESSLVPIVLTVNSMANTCHTELAVIRTSVFIKVYTLTKYHNKENDDAYDRMQFSTKVMYNSTSMIHPSTY